jgi:glycosyltransferase involved in cell wall biosynthesis
MKIKYIGNFNDGTGWAKAATYNALALDAAGHDIYCEEFSYNKASVVLEPYIENLINKKSEEYDIIVNHVLPNDYKYSSAVKNVGFVSLETLNLSSVPWLKKLSIMDEIWVPNIASKECLKNSGIESGKIKVFPHTFNFYKTIHADSNQRIAQLSNGTFNFVFNGEFTKRKNIEALLIAFHNEFENIEPVNLFIKTNRDANLVNEFCSSVKARMKKIGGYKSEIVVAGYIDENTLLRAIKDCHAFVMPSYGEAWCYPALEAMALGIPPIYTKGIGIGDFDSIGLEVPSRIAPCYAANDTFEDLYTSKDLWLEIDILELQKVMRNAYESLKNPNISQSIKSKCVEKAKQFDFTNTEITKGLV